MWTPPNPEFPPPKAAEPALHRAARIGDHKALRTLVEAGADPDEVFDLSLDPGAMESPATPLMIAAGSGDGATAATVRLLLKLGAKPRTITSAGSAVSYACLGLGWNYKPGGDAARLKALLAAGAPVPIDGWAGPRLVASVAEVGDVERLRLLLDYGLPADPVRDEAEFKKNRAQAKKFLDGQLPWPLRTAAKFSLDKLVPSFFNEPLEFEIPVFAAASAGSVPCLELLKEAGADLQVRSASHPNALHVASSAEAVTWLLEQGLDPAAADDMGHDAFGGLLSAHGDGEVPMEAASALLTAIPDLERQEKWPHTRLADAAWYRNVAAVRLLLKLGVSATPPEGCPPALHCVCWQGSTSDEELDAAGETIIDLLVAAGADVKAADEKGVTALHEAVDGDWSYATAVRALLRHGAEPDPVDQNGRTPLMLTNDPDCVRELLFAGADPLRKDNEGKSALSRARLNVGGHKVSALSAFLLRGVISKTQLAESAENTRQEAEETLALLDAAAPS